MAGRAGQVPMLKQSPVQTLLGAGLRQSVEGGVYVPPDVIRTMRDRSIREATKPRMPSTARYVHRDGGGMGIDKSTGQSELPLDVLRRIRRESVITSAIHAARQHQVARLCRPYRGKKGSVGWRVVHKDHEEADATPPEGFERLIATGARQIAKPSARYCTTFRAALVQLEEEFLTINRPCVELLYSDYDPHYVVGWRPVDGALVWPTLFYLERWIADHPGFDEGYAGITDEECLEMIAADVGHDIRTAEYVLVREGVMEGVFRPGRLIMGQRYTTTDVRHAAYQPSHVEYSAETLLAGLNTWTYNSSLFTRGMMSDFILGITGNVHDQDLDAFVDLLRQASQGVRRAHQPPIMPLPQDGTITKIDLKPPVTEMGFEGYFSLIVSLMCSHYRMDPSVINAKPWSGGAGPTLNAPNREMEISLAKAEGLQADVGHLTDSIFDPMLARIHPDLRLVWEYGDVNGREDAEVAEIETRSRRTPNEVRLLEGLTPLGFWIEPADLRALEELERRDMMSDDDDDDEEGPPQAMEKGEGEGFPQNADDDQEEPDDQEGQEDPQGQGQEPEASPEDKKKDKKKKKTEKKLEMLKKYRANPYNNILNQTAIGMLQQQAMDDGQEEDGDGFGGPGAPPGPFGEQPPGQPPQPQPGGPPGAPGGPPPGMPGQPGQPMQKAARVTVVRVHEEG